MALTYAQLVTASVDPAFQPRVRASLEAAAINIAFTAKSSPTLADAADAEIDARVSSVFNDVACIA